ncbi:redoxin domain-containing protein [Cupriavidus sp. CV2]|uniref:redoxin domain-containing protein n=1 Tax=Cupriavidus ulmosensis TaxID=3065913 RepID=UPI00296B45E8|nr:redoxin domain-containing protein [Cupriavidus sp. CV2]MDW3686863.1 redoxin domain-containing protein [Cupriavidus sp. CV2]
MSAAGTDRAIVGSEADADAELVVAASSEAASQALRAGRRAPAFALPDSTGRMVVLDDLLRNGPVVLCFSRGAWCSFGEQSLIDFAATTYPEILALGANAVAIVPPCSHAAPAAPLPMAQLTDSNMSVFRAYGLTFQLPPGLRPRYKALGYTPPSTRKVDSWLVPLPAIYLVDRDGIVAFAFIDVDYRNQLDGESLLRGLKALQVGRLARDLASRSLH